MPSSSFRTCCGPITGPSIWPRRSPNTRAASGASGRYLAEAGRFRWGDLGKRIASAAILAPLALGAIWLGASVWTAVIALVTLGLACEWVQLCGFRALGAPGLGL